MLRHRLDGAGNFYAQTLKAEPSGQVVNTAPNLTGIVDNLVDGAGNAYLLQSVTFAQSSSIIRVAPDGTQTTRASIPAECAAEAMDAAGNVYVSCQGQFDKVSADGTVTTLFALPSAGSFAVDAAGIFYFSYQNIANVKVTVPYTYVNGGPLAVDASGGIIYTSATFPTNRVIRLNRNAGVLTFPNTVPGDASSPLTVSYRNVGNLAVIPQNSSGGQITGPNASDFTLSAQTCTTSGLQPNQTCSASVVFQPAAEGARTATALVETNAPASPQTISLRGTGLEPGPVASLNPTSINFGSYVCVGSGGPGGTPILTNTGTSNLVLSAAPQLAGPNSSSFVADLSSNPNLCTGGKSLAPQQSCSISLEYVPKTAGPLSATLNFYDNAPNSPQQVLLSANGNDTPYIYPASGGDLMFRSPALHQTSPGVGYTFTNGQCGSGIISSMSITGPNAADFSVLSNTCTSTTKILPGKSCFVTLGYTPSTVSVESATFTITDNSAEGSPTTFTLHGFYTGPAQ